MCRYVAYLGEPLVLSDILYNPTNSLIHQASDAMESRTRINADGFGVGWYGPDPAADPAVFKDVLPAWNSANLRSLAPSLRSSCIMAHIRAARGFDPISRSNCHPFQFGRLLWMHNGDVPGRGRLHRRVVSIADEELVARIAGNTDTELAFTLFLTLLGRARNGPCTAELLAETLARTAEQIAAWWREDRDQRPLVLNFCLTDGHSILALRHALRCPEVPSLHYCEGSRFVCDAGVCRMYTDERVRCCMLASEILSDDPHWVTVENGTLLVVRDDSKVELRPFSV